MVPVGPEPGVVERAVALSWDQWLIVASFVAAPLVLVILWLADVIRPGSLSRMNARDTKGQPVAIWLFAAAITFFVSITGVMTVASMGALGVGGAGSSAVRDAALMGLGGHIFGGAAGIALAWLITSTPGGARAGLTARWKDVPVGLGAMLVLTPVIVALLALAPQVVHWITGGHPDRVAHEGLKLIAERDSGPWRIVLIVGAVVLAPIVEEIVYRGFLQSALVRACDSAGLSRWFAVAATSGAFAAVHANTVPVHGLAVLFVLSLAFGVAFERTGRLGVPIVMHAAFNAANIVVATQVM